jgi:two-component system repressor protein LuxO
MPPLRERGEDVLALAHHFLASYAETEQRTINGFDDNCLHEMSRYPWPGNVRQLENIVHRLVLQTQGPQIAFEQLKQAILDSDLSDGVSAVSPRDTQLSRFDEGLLVEPLWLTEKRAIQAAIDACDGNVNKAAGLLEVAPSTIYRKIQSWKSVSDS